MKTPSRLALVLGGATVMVSLAAAPATSAGRAGAPVRSAGPLTSYDRALVPAGATASVEAVPTGDGRTIVTLHVRGLQPRREYGAHAHNLRCGATGAAAGAHYQRSVDPATGGDPTKGSTDPAYANPRNEIWLDFTTNAAGNGAARAVVRWQFPAERRAQSVVIHNEHTHTGPTDSGVAGPRLGCLSVPF